MSISFVFVVLVWGKALAEVEVKLFPWVSAATAVVGCDDGVYAFDGRCPGGRCKAVRADGLRVVEEYELGELRVYRAAWCTSGVVYFAPFASGEIKVVKLKDKSVYGVSSGYRGMASALSECGGGACVGTHYDGVVRIDPIGRATRVLGNGMTSYQARIGDTTGATATAVGPIVDLATGDGYLIALDNGAKVLRKFFVGREQTVVWSNWPEGATPIGLSQRVTEDGWLYIVSLDRKRVWRYNVVDKRFEDYVDLAAVFPGNLRAYDVEMWGGVLWIGVDGGIIRVGSMRDTPAPEPTMTPTVAPKPTLGACEKLREVVEELCGRN